MSTPESVAVRPASALKRACLDRGATFRSLMNLRAQPAAGGPSNGHDDQVVSVSCSTPSRNPRWRQSPLVSVKASARASSAVSELPYCA
eukprot:2640449-Pyramimonas_sp.AAC.1